MRTNTLSQCKPLTVNVIVNCITAGISSREIDSKAAIRRHNSVPNIKLNETKYQVNSISIFPEIELILEIRRQTDFQLIENIQLKASYYRRAC